MINTTMNIQGSNDDGAIYYKVWPLHYMAYDSTVDNLNECNKIFEEHVLIYNSLSLHPLLSMH